MSTFSVERAAFKAVPNMRMQPDAASRPQDRAFFETWICLDCLPDLSVRRG
jgi:hypothetical protein